MCGVFGWLCLCSTEESGVVWERDYYLFRKGKDLKADSGYRFASSDTAPNFIFFHFNFQLPMPLLSLPKRLAPSVLGVGGGI